MNNVYSRTSISNIFLLWTNDNKLFHYHLYHICSFILWNLNCLTGIYTRQWLLLFYFCWSCKFVFPKIVLVYVTGQMRYMLEIKIAPFKKFRGVSRSVRSFSFQSNMDSLSHTVGILFAFIFLCEEIYSWKQHNIFFCEFLWWRNYDHG